MSIQIQQQAKAIAALVIAHIDAKIQEFHGKAIPNGQGRKFRSFKEARQFARKLGLKSSTAWKEWSGVGPRPRGLAALSPEQRSIVARKAARTRKLRAAGRKAALTRVRREAARKAVATRTRNARKAS
jgi:hypothetical protein